jgi:hypothetical protein
MTMRNDATRDRIVTKDKRRLRAVVARQGQVLLDTDFNQESRHQLERIETETVDSLGSPDKLVVPAGNTGFNVTLAGAPANFDIGDGRGYLRGWLLENPAICKLGTQPHPRTGDSVAAPAIIGLKALIRHIDPVEDQVLADVALGDAQASGRALIDWQVFPFAAAARCANVAAHDPWKDLIAPSTGTLAVLKPTTGTSNDPCSLTPGGGYTRLENLLYRFEVHDGVPIAGRSTIDGPRFGLHDLKIKFSRRNASTLVRITDISGAEFTVAPPALDPRNWFAPGLYAEIVSVHDDVDPRAALLHERLFPVALAADDRVILPAANVADIVATGVNTGGSWFLRLWDAFPGGTGIATVSAPANAPLSAEIELGDGLKIQLGGGAAATFRRGDYWTGAARANGSFDWPITGGSPDLMTPHGPETRYAPIAALYTAPPAGPAFEDCRIPFATLTDRALLYRGGDGQSVFAPAGTGMVPLPGKLRVAVMRGETPVLGATVRWSVVTGAPPGFTCQINGSTCNAATTIEVTTDINGLAEVEWSIDRAHALDVHKVQAAILTGGATSQPPIIFTATFDTAAHTAYFPGPCPHLQGINNVQDALDTLCAKIDDKHRTLTLTSILLSDLNGKGTELIDGRMIFNALEVPYTSFTNRIAFSFDGGTPDIEIADYDPVVEVELDIPYPATDPDRVYWAKASRPTKPPGIGITGPFGFQRMRLDGTISRTEKGTNGEPGGLIWVPSAQALRFIETAPQHFWGQRISDDDKEQLKELGWVSEPRLNRILCRIHLRSAMIWVDDKKSGERLYLNAEHLGVRGPTTHRELLVAERDPQRAADLDIFVYLGFARVLKIRKKSVRKSRARRRT